MLITIDNGALELTVDTLGAQMMSLKRVHELHPEEEMPLLKAEAFV